MVEPIGNEFALVELEGLPEAFAELSSAMLAVPDSRQVKTLEFAALLHHAGDLAVSKKWFGLFDVCSLLGGQLDAFAEQAEMLTAPLLSACAEWAGILQYYLNHPKDPTAATALVEYLGQPCWSLFIEPGYEADLQKMLNFIGVDDGLSSVAEDAGELLSIDELDCLADDIGNASSDQEMEAMFADDSLSDGLESFGEEEMNSPAERDCATDVDPAWAALESLSASDGAECHMTDLQASLGNETEGGIDPGAFEEALALVAADVPHTDSLLTDMTTNDLEVFAAEAGAENTNVDDAVSMGDLEYLLTSEEEEDGLAAFADALVAEDLAQIGLGDVEAGRLSGTVDLPGSDSSLVEPGVDTPALAVSGAGDRDLPEGVTQLLAILIAELPQIEVALNEWVGLLSTSGVADDIKTEACTTMQELFGRLQMASDSMGLRGVSQACEKIIVNLIQVDSDKDQSHWVQILALLRDYLNNPLNDEVSKEVLRFLSDERLPEPLAQDEAIVLHQALSQPDFSLFADEVEDRVQEATAEHVSLSVGDDVSPDLLDGLLQELPQYSEEFSLAVQRLINGGSMEDVNDAQRVAHTLKGAGNVVGVRGVAELTHHLEDILIVLAKHETLPSRALAESLIKASDCLESMSDALQGFSDAPENAQQVLQEVLDWANLIDSEGPPEPDSEFTIEPRPTPIPLLNTGEPSNINTLHDIPAVLTSQDTIAVGSVSEAPSPPAQNGGQQSGKLENATLRVSATLVDDLLRLVGEATILNAQLRERVEQTQERALLLETQFDAIHRLGSELEELVDIKDFSSHREVDDDFDALEMDQYNELHSYSRRMIEAAVDAKEMGLEIFGELGKLDDMIVTQGQINSETHEGVLKTRMVPVDSVFARLQRCVRQTCRTTGKQVDLVLQGGDTLMDSEVLRNVVDPIMHLLRNAVDHGIEAAESRINMGKSSSGKLELSFLRDGNHILVRCKDDGGGLDYEAIRTSAVLGGLLEEGAEVSEEELKRMVLRPNFTTRGNVTQVSGRGIGLNAVYGQVLDLKGSLQLESVKDEGCTMDIRLPVTLLSTHALLVKVGQQTYALASRGIERIVHVGDGEFAFFGGEQVYRLDQQPYRARRLANVLGLEAEAVDDVQRSGSVILMEIDEQIEAVVVDEVVGSRELVVKTLGQYMPKLTGIVGATILGDGQVSPVLDLVEMLRQPVAYEQHAANEYGRAHNDKVSNRPIAIVVDDSLSARRALAQLLGDAGYEVQTACDGMEAVDLLSSVRPDIMFVDMEMPRMNGIELTAHVRSRGSFDELPVVMITSRSTEKHRRQAAEAGVNLYLTKPFSDDQLIGQIEELTDSLHA